MPIGISFDRDTTRPYSEFETEANEFAAALLMPKERFVEVATNTLDDGYYYPSEIASEFNVSVNAVLIRGKILGLWR